MTLFPLQDKKKKKNITTLPRAYHYCISQISFGMVKQKSYSPNGELTRSGQLTPLQGPVTDYSATMINWMRRRQPLYKGGYRGELERPSPSYIVDVSIPI